jgi:hypothetical protein
MVETHMDIKLTEKDIWNSTIFFGLVGIVLFLLLAWLFRDAQFRKAPLPITLASGLFWGVLAALAFWLGWEVYYQYLYPAWVRPLGLLDAFLYALIGLGLWALAVRLPGSALLWFILFGAVEGVLEHILGIYGMHILDKVPWLKGLPAGPLLLFSFFEYIVYWDLTAGLAWLLQKIFYI